VWSGGDIEEKSTGVYILRLIKFDPPTPFEGIHPYFSFTDFMAIIAV
jgi:hypothetical protein